MLTAAGCSDTKGDLLEALNGNNAQGEDEKPLCISPEKLGIDAFETNDGKHYIAEVGTFSYSFARGNVKALDPMKEKGYASQEATSLQKSWANFADAFELTEKGRAVFTTDAIGIVRVCVGEKRPTEVLEYTEPSDQNPRTNAQFTYEVVLNDLVGDLGIEEALRKDLNETYPGRGSAHFVKTNEGWRMQMVSWSPGMPLM